MNLTKLLCKLDVFVIDEFPAVQLLLKDSDKERVSAQSIGCH